MGQNRIVCFIFLSVYCFLVQFEGISGESHMFFRAGDVSTLPCDSAVPYGLQCSTVDWFYYKDHSSAIPRVSNGQVVKDSPGFSRLRLSQNCSLIIHHVSAEDYGRYICRLGDRTDLDSVVYLSVLTVSLAPPNSSPNQGGSVIFQCTMSRVNPGCKDGRIRWLDQHRHILPGDNIKQRNCVSYLTLDQNQLNRKYICQYLSGRNTELISADYTLGPSGVISQIDYIRHYHTPGEDISLHCDRQKHHGPLCSDVNWIYINNLQSKLETKVKKGQIVDNDSSSRLRLLSDCSLMVHNISVEDSGLFVCRLSGYNTDADTNVYLNVLTVSLAPPNTSPNQDGGITLQCSMLGYDRDSCAQGSLRWLNINGTVLSGAGISQNKCVSYLTVDHQSQHTRTFICQYEERGEVKISAGYSLEVRSVTVGDSDTNLLIVVIIYGAVDFLLVLLVVAVEVFLKIKYKKNSAQTIEETEERDVQM